MFARIWLISLSSVILFTACQNKKETIYLPAEKKADEDMTKGFSVNKTQFQINKSSLGKVYLLTPYSRSSGRTPQWEMYRAMIVAFEKQNAKLVMFNLTHKEVYSQIKPVNKVDSFDIIAETDDALVVDFKAGFKSIPMNAAVDIVDHKTITDFEKKSENGSSDYLQIKDSVLSEVKIKNEKIEFTQTITIVTNEILQEDLKELEEKEKKITLSAIEKPSTLYVDLKAYVANPNFKPKEFDKNQNFGFFVNLTSESSKLGVKAQIAKWDVTKKTKVYISDNTPTEVIPLVQDSVQYWNKALGTESFEVVLNHPLEARPEDQSINFRWIEWRDAGFAYAYGQLDPLTGEIYRGQVFMTSSFVEDDLSVKIPQKIPDSFQAKTALCIHKKPAISSSFLTANAAARKKYNQDMVRMVITHELGHVMGLRHNFAASSQKTISDQEAAKIIYEYQGTGDVVKKQEITTTIMDYIFDIPGSYNGFYLKDHIYSYDSQVINWGYYNKIPDGFDINKVNQSYCSDEHIGKAGSIGKSIIGCTTGDLFSNLFYEEKVRLNEFFSNRVAEALKAYLMLIYAENKFTYSDYNLSDFVKFQPDMQIPNESLYQLNNSEAAKYISIKRAKDINNYTLTSGNNLQNMKMYSYTDLEVLASFKKSLQEVGGLSSMLNFVYQKMKDEKLDLNNQLEKFFSTYSAQDLGLEVSIYEKFKVSALKTASTNQDTFSTIVFKYLPAKEDLAAPVDQKTTDGKSNIPSEVKKIKFLYDAELGDVKVLMNLYFAGLTEAKEKEIQDSKGTNYKLSLLKFNLTWTQYLDEILNLSNWPFTAQMVLKEAHPNNFQKYKSELRKAALEPLELLIKNNFTSQPASWLGTDIETFLAYQDWTKIKGLQMSDLNGNLYLLKHLDKIK